MKYETKMQLWTAYGSVRLLIYFNDIQNTEMRSNDKHKKSKHEKKDIFRQMPLEKPEVIWPSEYQIHDDREQNGQSCYT